MLRNPATTVGTRDTNCYRPSPQIGKAAIFFWVNDRCRHPNGWCRWQSFSKSILS